MPSSMPPPRKLPQRSWAASIPTILTHNALHVLLLPSPTPCLVPGLAGSYLCSPLERFLGSVIMRRHLQRIIQLEPNVSGGDLRLTHLGLVHLSCSVSVCLSISLCPSLPHSLVFVLNVFLAFLTLLSLFFSSFHFSVSISSSWRST